MADGGTDRMLVPVIQWAIHRLDPEVEILEPEFTKRRGSVAVALASPDSMGAMITFVHRDAEGDPLRHRLGEFAEVDRDDVVPVVPVRMSEAWLLVDAEAIARAADRPGATIDLPALADIEGLANPKQTLENLILEAAGAPTGRKRKVFLRSMVDRRINVASLITDYSPLEELDAFAAFQKALEAVYPYR